jgi:hypothetical protein
MYFVNRIRDRIKDGIFHEYATRSKLILRAKEAKPTASRS